MHSALPHGMLVRKVCFVPRGVNMCLPSLQGATRGLGKAFPPAQAWQKHQWRHQAEVSESLEKILVTP